MKIFNNIVDGLRTARHGYRYKIISYNPPLYSLQRLEDLYIDYANYFSDTWTAKTQPKEFEIWLTTEV